MRSLKERYINLFTDFGFKKLFGSEMNKELLATSGTCYLSPMIFNVIEKKDRHLFDNVIPKQYNLIVNLFNIGRPRYDKSF